MKKTIFILIILLGITTLPTSGQVVEINKADSINILSWCNIEVTQDDNYHVQLVTTQIKAARIISNQIAARQDNKLYLPYGEYHIQYIDEKYVLYYSDSLYQWDRIKNCRRFIKQIVYSYLHPH